VDGWFSPRLSRRSNAERKLRINMRVVVTFEAPTVKDVLDALHTVPLDIVKISEEEAPPNTVVFNGDKSQDKVAAAIRSQIAPAVTSE
jgi:hypothetical protein